MRAVTTTLLLLSSLVPWVAAGQSSDMAAERARLANQRIQAEAELRAREEAQTSEPAVPAAVPQAPADPLPSEAGAAQSRPQSTSDSRAAVAALPAAKPQATDANRMSRGLEQLRQLGELKDAGYLTEAEFQRIKQRIIEAEF